jgi:hypothetical protein
MYFGGTSSDYATLSDNSTFDLGSSDFTIEMFVYDTARGSAGTSWISKWGNPASVGRSFILALDGSNLVFYMSSDGTNAVTTLNTSNHGLTLNTWHHIAVTRSGNDFKVFIDGVAKMSATISITLKDTSLPLCIGANYENVQASGAEYAVNGYIENLQILKGVAKYTTNFTPPTSTQGRIYQAES